MSESTKPLTEGQARRQQLIACRRVLLMVNELHIQGFQQLRICPSINAGGNWRCSVTPVSNTLRTHGSRIAVWSGPAVHYSAGLPVGAEERYGLVGLPRGGPGMSLRRLSQRFLEHFPAISEAGYGDDWEYAGWFEWMLHLTFPDALPYAVSEWEDPEDYIPTMFGAGVRIPLPPPGEAEGDTRFE